MNDLPIDRDPQRAFSTKQRARIFHLAQGKCQVNGCGKKIRGGWIAGHIKAHGLGGKTVVENGRVECLGCAKLTHAEDTGMCAKADRQGVRKGQQARRKKNGSQLKGRGFDKTKTKKFGGKVVPRKPKQTKENTHVCST